MTVTERAPSVEVAHVKQLGSSAGREHLMGIQRSRILVAMVEIAAERGASNVAVAHVVQRSGISRRTFYELFPDREACYLQAFDETVRRARDVVVPAYQSGEQWPTKLRTALTALLGLFEEEPALARLLVVDSLGAGVATLERRRAWLDRIVTAVELDGFQVTTASSPPMRVIAEGVVGAVISVIHARLSSGNDESLMDLVNPLMSMIVLPYLGDGAARKELEHRIPRRKAPMGRRVETDPLFGLGARLTYRTVRVLLAVGAAPGASNRDIGVAAGIQDQGQISKLLSRLGGFGLVDNTRNAKARGAPNVWRLTPKGLAAQQTLSANMAGSAKG
jgi:AcrR family transcriptional regulator/DNA-binding MarR family transcriptional regulator